MALKPRQEAGYSLPEMMVVVVIISIVILMVANMAKTLQTATLKTSVQAKVQESGQSTMQTISRLIQEADGGSIVISQKTSQPPYSWIEFQVLSSSGGYNQFDIYQQGSSLILMKNNTQTSVLSTLLDRACFTFPSYPVDTGVLSVSLSFSATYANRTPEVYTLNNTIVLLAPLVRSVDRGI